MKKLITIFVVTLVIALSLTTTVLAQAQSTKFQIITPTADQTIYGNRIPILFSLENFTIIDEQSTKAKDGQGHILLWLDDESKSPDSATKVTSDAFTFSDVTFGDHTLYAQLVTSDNKPLNPPLNATVKFKTAELPSSNPPAATSFDKNTSLVILIIVALVIIAAWWYTREDDLEEVEGKQTSKPKTAKKTVKKARKSTSKRK